MRIGQILIESEMITAKQLSSTLEYGQSKHIALGRVLKLLKILDEPDIERALHTQKLIRMGLSPVLAVEALKKAVKEQSTIEQALQGRHQEALANLAESGKEQQKSSVEVDYATPPDKLIETGDKLLLCDQCAEAEENYLVAKKVLEKQLGKNHINLAPVFSRLGNTYMAMERFEDAEVCYEEALVLNIRYLPSDHVQVAQAYESLADLNKARNDETQAAENFRSALDILEKKLPAQLGLYAAILRKIAASAKISADRETRKQPIGELLKAAGLLSDEQLQTALKTSKQTREPVGTILRNSGIVKERDLQSALKSQFYVRQGVLTEDLACDLLARAARRGISLERLLHEANLLASDESRFETYRELAIELDQLVAAESSTEKAKDEVAPIAHKVASLYEQVGDAHQAEVYYSRALKVWGADLKGDLTAARTCVALARLQQSQGRMAEVIPLLFKALEHRQHALGPNHEETIETLEDIAEAELQQDNATGAMGFLRSSLASREGLGHVDGQLLRSVALSADCHKLLGNFQEAEAAYLKAITLAQAGFGSASPALAAIVEKLGDYYKEQKQMKEASAQFEYALKILKIAKKLDTQAGQCLKEKAEAVRAAESPA